VAATEPAPGKTVLATTRTTARATTTRNTTRTVKATAAAATTVTDSPTPRVTITPPHSPLPVPSPSVTPSPWGASCTVTDHTPNIQATVPQDEPASWTVDIYVNEYEATGKLYARVIIPLPGPLTVGSVVTAEGTPDTSLASCQFSGVGGHASS
jgi:hypothetical protein